MSECPAPNCPMKDIKTSLNSIEEKQEKFIEVAVDIKYLRDDIKELKDREGKEHDEIFERLRSIESETHHKDIYKSMASKVSKKDISILLSVLTFIFIAVELLIKFVVK